MSRTPAADELDELLITAVRAGSRPQRLRRAAIQELLARGKTLVRADGKLYRVECKEVQE